MVKSKNRLFINRICLMLSIVLAFSLVLSGCGETNDTKEKAGTKLSLEGAVGLPGDTVSIPISLSDNCGIWGSQILISYDSSVFSFVSCVNGEVFEMCDSNTVEEGICIITSQLGTEDTTANGLIATVKLKIKDIADDGEYKITIDEKTNFSNIAGELQEVSFEGCTVTVK